VKNISARAGDEVVEVYVSRGQTPEDPMRELCGIKRIHLAAGTGSDVQFTVSLRPLIEAQPTAGAAQAAAATAAAGKITFSVGGGQPLPGTQFVQTAVQP